MYYALERTTTMPSGTRTLKPCLICPWLSWSSPSFPRFTNMNMMVEDATLPVVNQLPGSFTSSGLEEIAPILVYNENGTRVRVVSFFLFEISYNAACSAVRHSFHPRSFHSFQGQWYVFFWILVVSSFESVLTMQNCRRSPSPVFRLHRRGTRMLFALGL